MKTQLISLIFLCVCALGFAQNTEADNPIRKITLSTGEVFVGEILVENEQIVMIRTANGNRYQFPRADIKSIETDFEADRAESTNRRPTSELRAFDEANRTEGSSSYEKFAIMIDLQGGISGAKHAFSTAPIMQASLVLGVKDLVLQNSFIGAGIGYNAVFSSEYSAEAMTFLPLFLRLQKTIGDNHVAPFFELDAGYGFSLNPEFDGGAMMKLAAGMAMDFGMRNTFYFGVFAGLQNFSGQLTQTKDFGSFTYHGNSTVWSLGAKVALKF